MSEKKSLIKEPDRQFKGLRQFNSPDGHRVSNRRDRMNPNWMHWFPTDSAVDRFARALCERCAVDMKEFSESFEFFTRTRRKMRASIVTDLCCGHGLTGLLFAIFEREVEQVHLVDQMCPLSFERIYDAALDVAPWVKRKVQFHTMSINQYVPEQGSSILGIHACGSRTDRCIDLAIELETPVALMPCCHSSVSYGARPRAFDESLGIRLAIDVDRTYRLRNNGYDVDWKAIPKVVTPMNRIIIGKPLGANG